MVGRGHLALVMGVAGLGGGCTDVVVTSRFAETSAICRFDAGPVDLTAYTAEPAYPDDACVDAVLADFSADVPALLAADGLRDPYDVVRGEPALGTVVGSLLGAARAFHTTELGTLDDLAADDPLRTELDAVSQVTGDDRIGPLAYDFMTARIAGTTSGDTGDADAGMNRRTGRMVWDLRDAAALDGAALLLHESRHRDGWRHVDCGDGTSVCDEGDGGPVGFQMAMHARVLAAASDGSVVDLESERIDWLAGRIL